jgi:hypothetical protein
MSKINAIFSPQDLMNAMGIIYLQYWLQLEATSMFFNHLQILKAQYCHAKITKTNGVCHFPLLDVTFLEL